MIIDLKANLKLNSGGLMRKGRYDDKDSPFPQEILDEIAMDKERKLIHKRNMIEVLSETPKRATLDKPVEEKEEEKDTNFLDPGTEDVKTTSPDEEKEDLPKEKVARKVRRKK